MTIWESSAWVALHGVQKADENCTMVARDPRASPNTAEDNRWPGIALLERIAPCLRFHQNPYAEARASTMRSGR